MLKLKMLILVLCAAAFSAAASGVPTAYWPMNEGAGTRVMEVVSGTFSDEFPDGIAWTSDTPGPASLWALDFNEAYVGTGLNAEEMGIAGIGPKTLAGWIKTTETGYRWIWGWSPTAGSGQGRDLRLCIQDDGKLRFEVSLGFRQLEDGPRVNTGEWTFVAAVIGTDGDYSLGNVKFYIDGQMFSPGGNNPDVTIDTAGTNEDLTGPNQAFFGVAGNVYTGAWIGQLGGFWVFDRALTVSELDMVRAWTLSELMPINPSPSNGETFVPLNTVVQWEQQEAVGDLGVSYDVYFGDDPNEFSDTYFGLTPHAPTGSEPPIFFFDPGYELNEDTPYFWRVDVWEPNDVGTQQPILHRGPVWRFRTTPLDVIIETHPVSKTISAGSDVSFTVTARNADAYAWYKVVGDEEDPDELVGYGPTLSIDDVQFGHEGYYYCVVTNQLPPDEGGIQISDTARLMTERLVARWTLAGTLEAMVTHPDENWDGVYVDPNELGPLPSEDEVVYTNGPDGSAAGAVKFNGESVVMIPDSAEFFNFHPQGLTLTAWVLGPSGGDWRRPVNKSASYAIVQQAAGWIDTLLQGGPWQNAIPADKTDVWRFVAMTYDPETSERVTYGIYDADGPIEVLNRATLTQTDIVSGSSNVIIGGASATASTYNYPGSVADVRIYNYALDALGVIAVYHDMLQGEPVCTDPDDPKLRYDFNNDCRVDLADFALFATDWLSNNVVSSQ